MQKMYISPNIQRNILILAKHLFFEHHTANCWGFKEEICAQTEPSDCFDANNLKPNQLSKIKKG